MSGPKKRSVTDLSGATMSSTFSFGGEESKAPPKGPTPEPVGTSQLNPADVLVDESMPSYSAPYSFTSKPPVSDEDVAEGKPLRIAARKKAVDALKGEIH
jgi:hypothetical protein